MPKAFRQSVSSVIFCIAFMRLAFVFLYLV